MNSLSMDAVVGQIVKDYIQQPDYSEIRDKVQQHLDEHGGFVRVRTKAYFSYPAHVTCWGKILFTTGDSVVLEDLEMICTKTRFNVQQILYTDWANVVKQYIDETHEDFRVCRNVWEDGCRMYR